MIQRILAFSRRLGRPAQAPLISDAVIGQSVKRLLGAAGTATRHAAPIVKGLKAVGRAVQTRLAALADWLRARGFRAPNRSIGLWIVLLNAVGLLALVATILLFSPYQAWLITSKQESLLAHGKLISSMIANAAYEQAGRIVISPQLMEPAQNEQLVGAVKRLGNLKLPFSVISSAPLIKDAMAGTGMRARVYSTSGDLIIDSDELLNISKPVEMIAPSELGQPIVTLSTRWADWFDGSDLPVYRDIGKANGLLYPEVMAALQGNITPLVLMNERGRRMVGIAVPVTKANTTLGVVMLSTREGEIDKLVWREQRAILWLSAFGVGGMIVSSILLAWVIARPLHQLSHAAERVQSNLKRREELPDLSNRRDEIGDLSQTLRAMTNALYQRIEASERFAADVAHELKNPLCSVRNAAETLPLAKNDADREQLALMIQGDVKRLTRLIDDISKATRVVADMAFNEATRVDLADVVKTVVEIGNDVHVRDGQRIELTLEPGMFVDPFAVEGHDLRLGQVFKNLIDNALSFSPPDGLITVTARRAGEKIVVIVEDQGPGIPAGNLERIFLRFYTDRPEASFGNNSGLGLSICKEIVEAHHGRIWAENRVENTVVRSSPLELGVVDSRTLGARFVVELPARSMQVAAKGTRQRGQAGR